MERRVTQSDVARRAGVTRPAVTMALRGHPSIPLATQERIRRIAEEMGYVPDPMLSALASYRSTLRPASYHGTLAWLGNNLPPFDWREVSMFRAYYDGAVRRAASYGYNIEVFDFQAKGSTPEKIAKAFRFRNITGVLLTPQPGPSWELSFPWEHFSFVTFGYSLVRPALHTVAPTQFRAMMMTMRKLYEKGYRRIGFGCSFQVDERTDHHLLGGYLVEKALVERKLTMPLFDEENADAPLFKKWFLKHRPDAIVTGNPRLLQVIEEAGFRVPEDVGLACPTLPEPDIDFAGVYEDSFHMGETAVDTLVGMIHRGERGIPERPHYVHVPGLWLEGRTLRDMHAPEKTNAGTAKRSRRSS